MTPNEQAQRGFTLVELMISLAIFSFAIAGLLSVAVSITSGYHEQRASIQAEAAAQVPIDFLADAIRQASPAVSDPSLLQDMATCTRGAVSVSNNTGTNGSDVLYLMYASGSVATSTRTAYGSGVTSIDVNDASQLSSGDFIIISNYTNGALVQITNVSGSTLTLASACGTATWPATGYPVGSLVIRAQYAKFFVDTLDGVPTLFMDADADGTVYDREPLAEGIEDFQVAEAIDSNSNGSISEVGAAANDDEWFYNFTGDTAPAATAVPRALRVTLVAKSLTALRGNYFPFYRPGAEDHAAGTTFDAYRRREMKTTVELRNIGGSP